MAIRKILVPTDFSPCADTAATLAIRIAKKSGAALYFMHSHVRPTEKTHVSVVDESFDSRGDPGIIRARDELNKLVAAAEQSRLEAIPLIEFTKGSIKLVGAINDNGIDLVVMGSHGVRGMQEFVLGSTAQHMVRHSTVPVLVAKRLPERVEFKNILFASTFEEDVMVPLAFLISLAGIYNACIHLLYINHVNRLVDEALAKDRMKKLTEEFNTISFTNNIAETNDEEWAIHQFSQQLEADLIALTPHDNEGTFKMFSPSVAEHLVNHEEIPVLVIPAST